MSKKPGVFNRVTPHPELIRSLPTAFKESRGTRKRYSFNFFKKLERKGEHSNLKRRKAVLFFSWCSSKTEKKLQVEKKDYRLRMDQKDRQKDHT